MSTPDERHYLRLFESNGVMQENFLIYLLSMQSYHERRSGVNSQVVNALDVVIDAFTKEYSDWESEQSVAFGGVQYARERLSNSDKLT